MDRAQRELDRAAAAGELDAEERLQRRTCHVDGHQWERAFVLDVHSCGKPSSVGPTELSSWSTTRVQSLGIAFACTACGASRLLFGPWLCFWPDLSVSPGECDHDGGDWDAAANTCKACGITGEARWQLRRWLSLLYWREELARAVGAMPLPGSFLDSFFDPELGEPHGSPS